jgi:23S rRNA C2498 (ribose-2'-O)-methylase RlmM
LIKRFLFKARRYATHASEIVEFVKSENVALELNDVNAGKKTPALCREMRRVLRYASRRCAWVKPLGQ